MSSCAYRVSTSGLSTNGRNTPLSTYPSPPGTPPLRHLALSDRLQRTEYELKEKSLGEIGSGWTTSDAFEALVRKEDSGIGQIWLDGQSVSHPPVLALRCIADGLAKPPYNHYSSLTDIRNHLLPLFTYPNTSPTISTITSLPFPHQQLLGPLLPLPRRTLVPLENIERE